jgi:cytochrome c oxidase subunit 2
MKKLGLGLMALGAFIAQWVYAGAAMAEEGYPSSWQLSLQTAVTPMGERLHDFHKDLNYIIFAIAIFVIVLIVYTMIRFREKANPTPSQTTHNVILEIFWTIIPIGILFYIVFPSFSLLFYQHKTPEFDMTLKVTGYQWYWGYEYPDHDGINFLSYMKKDDELKEGEKRLLATDNPVVLPTDRNIQIIITAADVLHSWTVPSFSVKRDAVPGRLNETWVRIDKPGTYYGQCSEICGKDHAYMPIMIKAVTPEEFDEWLVTAKEEFAYNGNSISTQGTMTADAATLGATAQ